MGFGVLETKSFDPTPGTVLLVDNASPTGNATPLKRGTGRNQHIVLAPQPSDDPNDPLNWSSFERHLILFIILLGGIVITDAPLLSLNAANYQLAIELHTSYAEIAKLTGYLLLAAGATGPFVAASARKYGKRPAYVACSTISLVGTVLGQIAPSYDVLVASRILHGIGLTSYETVMTASIGDLFFVHERGPRIACVTFVLMSFASVIAIIGGIITDRLGWHWNFHTMLPFNAFQLIMVFLFVPETTFNRNGSSPTATSSDQELSPVSSWESQAPSTSGKKQATVTTAIVSHITIHAPRRRKSFAKRLSVFNGVLSRDSVWKMVGACLVILTNVVASFSIFVSSVVMAWGVSVGVLSSLIFSAPPYSMTPDGVGYTSIGALAGGLLGALFMSAISDPAVKWMTKRNAGIYEPEFRLVCVTIGTILTVVGLSGFGHTLQDKGSVYLACFFWGVLVFGSMVVMVATTAYALDALAEYAVEIFMMNMVIKNFMMYGISNGIVLWLQKQGPARMFDMMAGTTVVACSLTIPMYILGKRYRAFWARHDVIHMLKLETDKTNAGG